MARRTKADTSGQIEQVRELSAEQELALAALLGGATDKEASSVAGVRRQTVTDWQHHDSSFVARLNFERAALWAANVDKLRAMVPDALGILANDLQNAEDVRLRQAAAVHILRAVGLYGSELQPKGEVSPAAVESEWRTRELLSVSLF